MMPLLDSIDISNFSIVKLLLQKQLDFLLSKESKESKESEESKKSKDTIELLLENLPTESHWQDFKRKITDELYRRKNYEAELLRRKRMLLVLNRIEDEEEKKRIDAELIFVQEKLKTAREIEKAIKQIDAILLDTFLQEKLLQENSSDKVDAEHGAPPEETFVRVPFDLTGTLSDLNDEIYAKDQAISVASVHDTTTVLGSFTHSIPLVSDFLRSLSMLNEARIAYAHPEDPHRKIKMGVGLVGGLVSVGIFVVSALALASVGLLATFAAAPILIIALIMGVCSTAIYRDAKIFRDTNQSLRRYENELKETEKEFSEKTENLIEKAVNNDVSQEVQAIKVLQNRIDNARRELDGELKAKAQENILQAKRQEIIGLCNARNKEIEKVPHFSQQLVQKLQSNPELSLLHLRKINLKRGIQHLENKKSDARIRIVFGVVAMVALSLLLAAVCATGVGAAVLAVAATTIIVGTAAARLVLAIKAKREEAASAKQVLPKNNEASSEDHSHSSLFEINRNLSNGRRDNMAKAPAQSRQPTLDSKTSAQPVAKANNDKRFGEENSKGDEPVHRPHR